MQQNRPTCAASLLIVALARATQCVQFLSFFIANGTAGHSFHSRSGHLNSRNQF